MDYLLGLDMGTSAVKGAIMSVSGETAATFTQKINYSEDGSKKLLDPKHFTEVCIKVISELVKQISSEDKVLALCSCCASGNLILLDSNCEPITPIIGWQTTVPKDEVNSFFTDSEKKEIHQKVGWNLSGHYSASYLAWIKKYKSELLEKTDMITMNAEYFNYLLTGKWGVSVSMGTPFYLIDQEKGEYNIPLLKKLGVESKNFPPIFDKGTVLGNITENMAKLTGLTTETKVVLGSFDHPSGAMGAGVFDEGEMLLSCGTSWVEFFPVQSRDFALSTKGLVDRYMLKGSPYCVMKALTSVSIKIDNLREHYLGKISHKEFDDLASNSVLGCNGISFDFTDDDYTKYSNENKCDIARAIIECAAYKLKNNLKELREFGLLANKITMIGGITNSSVCVDIISQILEMQIEVVNGQSAGAIGSCLLAGIGIGVYEDEKQAYSVMKPCKI